LLILDLNLNLDLDLILRSNLMKILLAASEVAPFAKTGGLADVTGSLPKALKKMGHDVRIIMPYYSEVQTGGFTVKKGRKSVEIKIGDSVKKGFMRHAVIDDIPVYFLENREYYQRKHLYGTPAGDYPDNPERFTFFCRGVLQLMKKMDFRPDIIHCNDWQTALIPVLMKYELAGDPFYMKTGVLYTIHNLAYQGLFPAEVLERMGLDESYFAIDRLEYYGKLNLMKGAILAADVINTVSETYCREIQGAAAGCGLEGVLQQRSQDLFGVLNGLDCDVWDPSMDSRLHRNYSVASLAARHYNKRNLQKELGFQGSGDIPVLGLVSRLAEQKGIDLVLALLPFFRAEQLQLVILGTGDERYIKALQKAGAANIHIHVGYDQMMAHRVYASSDIFIMPSRYEPCGLGQLIALRYGAIPVARKTGGLADTIVDLQENPREANGFLFEEYDEESFQAAIERALSAYRDQKVWKRLVRRGMEADHSWGRSAVRYEELYRLALSKKVL